MSNKREKKIRGMREEATQLAEEARIMKEDTDERAARATERAEKARIRKEDVDQLAEAAEEHAKEANAHAKKVSKDINKLTKDEST